MVTTFAPLFSLMARKKISISELHHKTGIARSTIYKFKEITENPSKEKDTDVRLSCIKILCAYFHCGVESIMQVVPEAE